MNSDQFVVVFRPSGRGKARCASDPKFPRGKDVKMPGIYKNGCLAELPYPAPECGVLFVSCKKCGTQIAVTAAGRPDDPRTLEVPCSKSGANLKAQEAAQGTVIEQ